MKKKIIYYWNDEFKTKKEVAKFFEKIIEFSGKNKVAQIVIPNIVLLQNLILNYKGKRINFAVSGMTKICSFDFFEDLKIKYFFWRGELDKKKINKIIEKKMNLIFILDKYKIDKNGLFFDKLEKEILNIFSFLKKKNESELYFVFSHLGEIERDDLNRIFLFIRKIILDYFQSGTEKIYLFYQVNEVEKYKIFEKNDLLDGVYVEQKNDK